MRPERLAAIQPSRISASRALIAQAGAGRWRITRKHFEIDERGRGTAEYRIDTGAMLFSFPVFSFEPSKEGRTGRIIGRAWDMMGALIEGELTAEDFATTRAELPKLYRGRATPGTLIWCRSNRSSRAFEKVCAALAEGHQPAMGDVTQTCYLMRNTGLDGNGTFGTRSFRALEVSHPLRWSLSAQMMCAYMMRVFSIDIVNHLARSRSPKAIELDPKIARYLGIGNGSALGLMLFVNNHPRLIDRWLRIREEAIAHARLLDALPDGARLAHLDELVAKAIRFRREDRVAYENATPSAMVADDLEQIRAVVGQRLAQARAGRGHPTPFADIARDLVRPIGADAEETLNSLLIELVPGIADALVATLVVDEEMTRRPAMTTGMLRELVRTDYGWAFRLGVDPGRPGSYVWYKSVTAEEPRRGLREEIEADVINLGLDLPRLVLALDADLAAADPSLDVARFLLEHPRHRAIVTRVQALSGSGYHSPHADIMSPDFVPAHITRLLNVGIHGIDKARDYLNRNLRGVLFHGAPLAEDLATGSWEPDWFNPAEPVL